jgi:hypothetical protein
MINTLLSKTEVKCAKKSLFNILVVIFDSGYDKK